MLNAFIDAGATVCKLGKRSGSSAKLRSHCGYLRLEKAGNFYTLSRYRIYSDKESIAFILPRTKPCCIVSLKLKLLVRTTGFSSDFLLWEFLLRCLSESLAL